MLVFNLRAVDNADNQSENSTSSCNPSKSFIVMLFSGGRLGASFIGTGMNGI